MYIVIDLFHMYQELRYDSLVWLYELQYYKIELINYHEEYFGK